MKRIALIIAGALLALTSAAAEGAQVALELRKVSETASTITLGWTPEPDWYGYRFYRNGVFVSRSNDGSKSTVKFSKGTSYAVRPLVEGPGDTYPDAEPPPPPPPPPPDTTAPTVPQNQVLSGVTQTSVTMTWSAATDNVAVTGYNVFLNGVKVTTVTELSYAYTGLACGTTYTVALEAEDAAGNTSDRALASGSTTTAACSSPPPPPPSSTTMTPTQFVQACNFGATVRDVTVTGSVDVRNSTACHAINVTFQGTVKLGNQTVIEESRASGFYAFGVDNWQLLNNTFDGNGQVDQNLIWDEPAGQTPDNWVIRGNSFTNFYDAVDATSHSEALYIGYSTNGAIEGNTFSNNGNTGHVFLTNFGNQFNGSSYPRNICVRGNTFGPTWRAYFDIQIHGNVASVGPTVTQIRIDPGQQLPHGIADGTSNPSRWLVAC